MSKLMDKKNIIFGVMCGFSSTIMFSNILVVDGMISASESLFRGTGEPIAGFAIHGGESPDYESRSFSVDDARAYYGESLVTIDPGTSLEMALDHGINFGGNVIKREGGKIAFYSKYGKVYSMKNSYCGSAIVKFELED